MPWSEEVLRLQQQPLRCELKGETNMALYLVEPTFPDGLAIPMTDDGGRQQCR